MESAIACKQEFGCSCLLIVPMSDIEAARVGNDAIQYSTHSVGGTLTSQIVAKLHNGNAPIVAVV